MQTLANPAYCVKGLCYFNSGKKSDSIKGLVFKQDMKHRPGVKDVHLTLYLTLTFAPALLLSCVFTSSNADVGDFTSETH